jgi:putative FmdB family regulatory protein
MPTYEYACRSCGEHLEAVQSFSDPPLTKCPRCGGELRKVFGNIGIVFKGSGFYKTDNRSSRNGSVAKEHTEHAVKSDQSSNGSSSSTDSTSASASNKETSSGSSVSESTKASASKTTTVGAA